jgi:uncharacterized protein
LSPEDAVRRTITALAAAAAVILLGPAAALAAPTPATTALAAPTPATTALAAPTPAATAPPGATAYPAPAVCVDTTSTLPAATCARITSVLDADEKASPEKDQTAVALVPTTGDASIEDWSTGLFNAWGVGQKTENNGVLLVIALDDHRLRIATGDGLRSRLPDGQASEIIGGTITPLLKQGRTEDAVLAGLDGIRTALGHDVLTTPLAAPGTTDGLDADPLFGDQTTEAVDGDGGSGNAAWLWILLLVGIAVVGWVMSLARRSGHTDGTDDDSYRRRRSYRSFGSFGSSSSSSHHSSSSSHHSSGSFGGGHSSGGGSSSSW